MARPTIYGSYSTGGYVDSFGTTFDCPPLKTYQVSIIPKGATRSTYHGRYAAPSAEAAVEMYINCNASDNTGAKVAQERGGVVVVTPLDTREMPYGRMPAYGQELFNVAPVTPPPPPKRARITGRVYS